MAFDPDFFRQLANNSHRHSRDEQYFNDKEKSLLTDVEILHGPYVSSELHLGEIGVINFPFFDMGQITSKKLFGLDEMILFSFYFVNQKRYKNTLDLGANIGLHTLVMKKLGFNVTSYEPDLNHFNQIKKVMKLNNLTEDGLIPRAISDKKGKMEYVRVLGNTTGSHLLGSKENVYGPTDIVEVEVDDVLEVLALGDFDFIKMDVEGHEATLLNQISIDSIKQTDIMLEIGSEKNSKAIFEILKQKEIPAYAQKINWRRVTTQAELPSHHTHGSVFLSVQGAPDWN
jgi:FkbM family methyltransferase